MKIKITCNDKDYILAYTRKTARQMASNAEKLTDKEDVVETAEYMIKGALKAEQPSLSEEEAQTVAEYIVDNCQLIDDGDSKGLLTCLNDMIGECLPKGFTKMAAKNFTIIAE